MPTISAVQNNVSATHARDLETVRIGHARVHSVAFRDVLDMVGEHAALRRAPAYIVTPNAQHIVLLESDPYLREIYSNAALVVPDGASLLLAARLLRKKLKERVTGIDLFEQLCGRAAQMGLRVFLLGGLPGSAERAATKLKETFPALTVCGTFCPPLGFERDAKQLEDVASAIRAAEPHLLFVALGAPKQERWIHQHGLRLDVPVSMGIGGSFEMVSGSVRRAPKILQKIGLEWAFRLAMEPRRMWRRYLVGNLQFMAVIVRQLMNPKAPESYAETRMGSQL